MHQMFDEGQNRRAKLGFVLLATEQTIEENMFRMCPADIGLHFTRAPIPDSITVESLSQMAGDLAGAAATLLPDGSLDVITYACTSGSLVIGEDRVFEELRKGAPFRNANIADHIRYPGTETGRRKADCHRHALSR